ncbi:MAG: OmcA/MtrC family decaheme c-type cytochrome, partial [Syntrophales bacterium]|nr:OmcA/MtrC family decaheme c-type cytochrome [Syntrophales bacterium]
QPISTTVTTGAVSPDNNLQAEITGVAIGSPPVVTFKLFDENGQPLDPAISPGLTIRFYIARLKDDGLYANYEGSVKNADGTTSGTPNYENTTTTNGKGALAAVGNGVFTYTFFRDIKDPLKTLGNLAYDPAKTHTVAIEVYRNITDAFGRNFQQAKNVFFNFRPDGQPVTQTREIVATSNCNECHGKLAVHDGSRREVALCILCHNPGNQKPIDPNDLTKGSISLDFKRHMHRIHMGKKLPGNVRARALGGDGYSIAKKNFAETAFPLMSGDSNIAGTPADCLKCHRAGTDINGRAFGRDADNWKKNPTQDKCTTCHDTTTFDGAATIKVADATHTVDTTIDQPVTTYAVRLTSVPAVPHTGGQAPLGAPWPDDTCVACHPAELAGNNAYKMSVTGHHTILEKSSVYTGLNFQILSVADAKAGSKPTVTFKITDDAGNSISPSAAGSSFNLRLGYFKQSDYINDGMGDYGQPLSQSLATATANADGSYTIAFAAAIPASATGTGVIGMDGMRAYNIPATSKYPARAANVGGKAVQYYFDLTTGAQVTNTAQQRRKIVDGETRCNVCHARLAAHGGGMALNVQQCVICHNPNATDKGQRPALGVDGLIERPIHMKVMIHRIHTGENLDLSTNNPNGYKGFIIYDNEGSARDFSKVRFPRDRSNCQACHIDAEPLVFGLPLPADVLGTTTSTGTDTNNNAADDNVRIKPIKATCFACHDTQVVSDHADIHTASTGESCIICHKVGLLFGVDNAHKPLR